MQKRWIRKNVLVVLQTGKKDARGIKEIPMQQAVPKRNHKRYLRHDTDEQKRGKQQLPLAFCTPPKSLSAWADLRPLHYDLRGQGEYLPR